MILWGQIKAKYSVVEGAKEITLLTLLILTCRPKPSSKKTSFFSKPEQLIKTSCDSIRAKKTNLFI